MKVLCSMILLIAPALLGAAAPAPQQALNILFLFSDDQRFDTIHALGNRQIQTPNLDRLAQGGFAFTHAFCMGSMVGAVCVPSRAMLMTGRSLFRATAKRAGAELPRDVPLWPEVLGRAGYRTFGIGKWHNDRPSFNRAFSNGGPIFFGGMSDQRRIAVHEYDASGRYAKTNQRVAEMFSTEAAIHFLREQAGRQPFCLYVAFTSPHDPRTPPAEFSARYPPDQIRLPKNFLPEHPFDNGELKVRDEMLLPWPRTPTAVRQEIAAYYGMISHLDAQVGRILDALRETGQAERTLVIFAGDNGLALGRHGLLGKQNLYDHSVRVPLILNGPGVSKGRRSDALCYLFDLYPTICDLVGLPIPATVEGRSLAPLLDGRAKRVRDSVFGAYRDVQRMVRNERWKLISYPKTGRTQLFDLARDPDELRDLSAEGKHARRLAGLRARLADWQRELNDPLANTGSVAAQLTQ